MLDNSSGLCYNRNCPDEHCTGANVCQQCISQFHIAGKTPFVCGLTSPAVHLDNGSARGGRFAFTERRENETKRD
jgi:hypothetical protein